ncbi:MAG TPA: membrane or secreted protein [Flavobacteriaceae bacterium]|nr:membrane or secreted protein [Flavobacteriaceae bacterium]
MKLLLITFILIGLGIAGIAIKLWAKKNGKFTGTCASQNPMLNKNGEPCSMCGRTPDQFKDCEETQHS